MDDGDMNGEMMYENQDVALNLAEIVSGLGQGKLEDSKLEIITVGLKDSRWGKAGCLGDKEVCEEENLVDIVDVCI